MTTLVTYPVYYVRLYEPLTYWDYYLRSHAYTPITAAEVIGANSGQRPDLVDDEGRYYLSDEEQIQYSGATPQTLYHTLYRVTNGALVRVESHNRTLLPT